MEPIHTREGVFEGPGLLRKPRVGETLIYRPTGERMVVDHFDTTHENLMHVRYESGRYSVFIWQFRTGSGGLNRLLVTEDE